MSIQKETFLFDIEGVVTYPRFNEVVIKPLEKKGRNIKFWSYAGQGRAFDRLVENGLERYASAESCYTDEMDQMFHEIDRAQFAGNPVEDIVRYYRKQIGLSTDHTEITQISEEAKKWDDLRNRLGVGFKYPPIIGSQNFLLVESDCSMLLRSGMIERDRRLPRADWTASSEGAYSVILVPEHPEVWKIQQPVSPEQVVNRLGQITQAWNGKHTRIDLGYEMGIYPDSLTIVPPVKKRPLRFK